ncbi:uncharacterized protein DS421_17g580750 [Arachis hypogaea]|nr:uncharacterized protein DS421_17g580750 [Arachis hypogaea]
MSGLRRGEGKREEKGSEKEERRMRCCRCQNCEERESRRPVTSLPEEPPLREKEPAGEELVAAAAMASSPSPWLGSHRREPSLSAPPSGLPPLLPPGNAAAVVDNAAGKGFEFGLHPFEILGALLSLHVVTATVTRVLIAVGACRSRCGFVPPLSLDFNKLLYSEN